MKKIFSSIMTLIIAITMVSCGGNAKNGVRKAQELSGAGATFPLPFYNVVFENFAQVNGDIVAYGYRFNGPKGQPVADDGCQFPFHHLGRIGNAAHAPLYSAWCPPLLD